MAAQGETYGYDQPGDKARLGEAAVVTEEPSVPPYTPGPVGGYSSYPPLHGVHPVTAQPSSTTSTTVIMQQAPQITRIGPRNWGTGLCSCWDDMSICLCGACCSICLASQVSQDMGEHCCVPCCVPGWLIALRLKMRTQENIEGTLLNDCCTVACCGPCALCQLAREVQVTKMRTNFMGVPMQPTVMQV